MVKLENIAFNEHSLEAFSKTVVGFQVTMQISATSKMIQ